jgi:hypothetical protein
MNIRKNETGLKTPKLIAWNRISTGLPKRIFDSVLHHLVNESDVAAVGSEVLGGNQCLEGITLRSLKWGRAPH